MKRPRSSQHPAADARSGRRRRAGAGRRGGPGAIAGAASRSATADPSARRRGAGVPGRAPECWTASSRRELRAAAGRRPWRWPAPPATGRARRSSPTCAGRPRSPRATRCTSPRPTRWRATPPACWSRATPAGPPRWRATPTTRTAWAPPASYEQALPLGLYDDDRGQGHPPRGPRHRLAQRCWPALAQQRARRCAADEGAKLRFLVEPSGSPLLADLRARILQQASRRPSSSPYSPVAADGGAGGGAAGVRPAARAAARPDPGPTSSSALDADFLERRARSSLACPASSPRRREPGPSMNRLYVAEPCPTPTGSMADHRLRVRGSEIVGRGPGPGRRAGAGSGVASRLARAGRSARAGAGAPCDAPLGRAVAKDLRANRGSAWSSPGAASRRRCTPWSHALNAALGNVGTTVSYGAPARPTPMAGVEALRALVEEIAAGEVDTLVITAENPVYAAPADFKLAKLLERVPNVIYLGLYEDETARAWRAPSSPRPTCWSPGATARRCDGTVSIVQPLIDPLWGGTHRGRAAGGVPGRGRQGAHTLLRSSGSGAAVAEGRAPAATSRPPGRPGWPRGSSTRPAARPRPRRRSTRGALAGQAGPGAGGLRGSRRRGGWSWPSPSTPRSSTAASPTTPGCRSCPTRSPR